MKKYIALAALLTAVSAPAFAQSMDFSNVSPDGFPIRCLRNRGEPYGARRSHNPRVRTFAQQMITDHSQTSQALNGGKAMYSANGEWLGRTAARYACGRRHRRAGGRPGRRRGRGRRRRDGRYGRGRQRPKPDGRPGHRIGLRAHAHRGSARPAEDRHAERAGLASRPPIRPSLRALSADGASETR